MRFVTHEYDASTHHDDLRLERHGTLWSWALPKGVPTNPARNRLAVRVDDHDLDHLDFEDFPPVGDRAPGAVVKSIWDIGDDEVVRSTDDKLVVDLGGRRATVRALPHGWRPVDDAPDEPLIERNDL